MNGVLSAHYSYGGHFTIYNFKDDKLIGWIDDTQAIAGYEERKRHNDALAAQAAEQEADRKARRSKAIGDAFRSVGSSLQNNNTVNCTTTSFGNTAQTNCH